MNDSKITVSLQDREIILIGTAHISKESVTEVSRVIREAGPDRVCVELDEGRYAAMTRGEDWKKLDVVKIFREGKGFLLMANLVLSGFQRRMGQELGVKPGEEMKTAVETAKELGIPYAFCDREVQITLRRAWVRCGLWNRCKLLATLMSGALSTEKLSEGEIEGLKDRSELDRMMAELAEYLPSVKQTLIDERDHYLAAKIWAAGGKKTAAIVGAGHIMGLKTQLERIASGGEGVDVAALDAIPPRPFLSRLSGWVFPLLIVLLIGAGFFVAGAGVSLSMILRWLLWNGSLAALGSLIALAHPLAILVSFAGAPVATINPFIAVGFFSGIVQAVLHKPRVTDAETISDDVTSLRGIYRNRITRALLVFLLSSIGGAMGNLISIPALAGLLIK